MPRQCWASPSSISCPPAVCPHCTKELPSILKTIRGSNFQRYLLQKGPWRLLQHPQIKSRKPLFNHRTHSNSCFIILLRVHTINVSLPHLEKCGIKHLFSFSSRFKTGFKIYVKKKKFFCSENRLTWFGCRRKATQCWECWSSIWI